MKRAFFSIGACFLMSWWDVIKADYSVPLATFDGQEAMTTWSWTALNDPVMGGKSTSTLQVHDGIAVWDGETKIVPSLHAPGFCNMKTTSGFGITRKANDASYFTHLLLRVRSTIKYDGFKVSFAANTMNPTFHAFKTELDVVRHDGVWHTVAVPFNKFSNDWSSYTGRCDTKDPNGKTHTCCSATHPEVCPTKKNLKSISQMGIWAEGVAGKFHLEVKWIRAGTPSANGEHYTQDCSSVQIPLRFKTKYQLEFQALDANQDGTLDVSELTKDEGNPIANVFQSLRGAFGGRRRLGPLGMPSGSWDYWKNRAKTFVPTLTQAMKDRQEAKRAKKVLEKFDKDHDTQVSMCEYENAMYSDYVLNNQEDDTPVVVHG